MTGKGVWGRRGATFNDRMEKAREFGFLLFHSREEVHKPLWQMQTQRPPGTQAGICPFQNQSPLRLLPLVLTFTFQETVDSNLKTTSLAFTLSSQTSYSISLGVCAQSLSGV